MAQIFDFQLVMNSLYKTHSGLIYKIKAIMENEMNIQDYNFNKWQPVIDFIGVTDPSKRQWLTEYLQFFEDNGKSLDIPRKTASDAKLDILESVIKITNNSKLKQADIKFSNDDDLETSKITITIG